MFTFLFGVSVALNVCLGFIVAHLVGEIEDISDILEGDFSDWSERPEDRLH